MKQLGDRADLDSAITLHPTSLCILHTRFEQLGDRADLDSAITLHREALELRPTGHPDRSSSLNNLAIALQTRFKQLGDRADLDSAITLHREALELRPLATQIVARHSTMSLMHACILGMSSSEIARTLTVPITLHREALELRPSGHPYHGASLSNLAVVSSIGGTTSEMMLH
ncbi:hypothetical protein FOMPIDRAFT_1045122 [Fomitopsis schrenkii]|uniref:TPR-like protein n=1 Tax=Fomitopsis schrenkii TaxID=2126942 RepID=S8EL38_FOMSC|nr:hypothetical protein FOMPIDRAFT_1045122 [Fomitopsis schrenkii]